MWQLSIFFFLQYNDPTHPWTRHMNLPLLPLDHLEATVETCAWIEEKALMPQGWHPLDLLGPHLYEPFSIIQRIVAAPYDSVVMTMSSWWATLLSSSLGIIWSGAQSLQCHGCRHGTSFPMVSGCLQQEAWLYLEPCQSGLWLSYWSLSETKQYPFHIDASSTTGSAGSFSTSFGADCSITLTYSKVLSCSGLYLKLAVSKIQRGQQVLSFLLSGWRYKVLQFSFLFKDVPAYPRQLDL